MAEPFLSEIRIMSFNFAPKGWAMCNGQVLPINQNQPLFSLLGTSYGGNGQTTFALPDLRGRWPLHAGQGYVAGQKGGAETHTLTVAEMPVHRHTPRATATGGQLAPTGNVWAPLADGYTGTTDTTMHADCLDAFTGGGQAHDNVSPFLTLTFVIALIGTFPSQP